MLTVNHRPEDGSHSKARHLLGRSARPVFDWRHRLSVEDQHRHVDFVKRVDA